MPPHDPRPDPRLLGTWQSDRRKTMRHLKVKPGARPSAVRKLSALFGKLVVHWDRGTFWSELDGFRREGPYTVVARDAVSVVVRFRDALVGEPRLYQLSFEGDRYRIPCGTGFEYFRRIGPAPPAAGPATTTRAVRPRRGRDADTTTRT